MIKFFVPVFVAICFLRPSLVIAANTCSASSQTGCSAGYFCKSYSGGTTGTTYTCTSCSDATGGAYPYSDTGSTSINACYKYCGNKSDFQNGTWAPDNNEGIFYNGSDTCQWTDSTKITCNAGYYKSGDSCVKCPYGSTSRSGATSRKNCFFDSGTIINSNDGSISLSDIMYIY